MLVDDSIKRAFSIDEFNFCGNFDDALSNAGCPWVISYARREQSGTIIYYLRRQIKNEELLQVP